MEGASLQKHSYSCTAQWCTTSCTSLLRKRYRTLFYQFHSVIAVYESVGFRPTLVSTFSTPLNQASIKSLHPDCELAFTKCYGLSFVKEGIKHKMSSPNASWHSPSVRVWYVVIMQVYSQTQQLQNLRQTKAHICQCDARQSYFFHDGFC